MGAGPSGSDGWHWNWDHVRHLVLPAITLSVILMGIITRTTRGLVAETLGRDFVTTLRGKGMLRRSVFTHVLKNVAPSALAVMGFSLAI